MKHCSPSLIGLLAIVFCLTARSEEFAIAIGDSVSDGVPASGAGRLLQSTEEDTYSFGAVAGQLAFFEPRSQDSTLAGRLRWQLLRPSGGAVFGGFFSGPVGRIEFPETGTYRLRLYTDGTDPGWIGAYSFRIGAIPPDQTFAYTLGGVVSEGAPAVGAGRLEVAGAEDHYTFTVAAGQLAFFEALEQDAAFGGRVRWQLLNPAGTPLFGSFFSNPVGRIAMAAAGEYRIRVYTDATDPDWFGSYSFRTLVIPPDESFAYTVGAVVSDGAPAAGAGRLEVAGAEDSYTFVGAAGQLLFFRTLGQDAGFRQNLRWQLLSPRGVSVFASFFTNPTGRVRLPDDGVYRIRVYTDATNPEWLGAYSFQVTPIGADQVFAYTIGSVVSDGAPAAGAGRLEVAGAEDHYTFTGTSNQVVFFESLRQDAAFNQALRWQLIRPSGGAVFSSFFTNPQGRTVLPESGEYRIRVYTDSADPSLFGAFSFSTRGDVLDQQFGMEIGDLIVDGQPAPGAGNLETPGSTDTYSFEARAGQEVIFEGIAQAPEFQSSLRWELLRPGGGAVFNSLFSSPKTRFRLPDAGTYRLRVHTTGGNPAWLGAYSFRTFSEVWAYPDRLGTRPGESLDVTFDKFFFNDSAADEQDELSLELPSNTTEQGGSLSVVALSVRYVPPTGFTGIDRFNYRLRGSYGGTNETSVTVTVDAEVGVFATVVNSRRSDSGADFCLMGEASTSYGVESTIDWKQWTPAGTVTTDPTRGAVFQLRPAAEPAMRFFRARRQ